jgi:hypothetical protein
MEQSPYSETDSRLGDQQVPSIYVTRRFIGVHKSLPLGQMNPIHNLIHAVYFLDLL